MVDAIAALLVITLSTLLLLIWGICRFVIRYFWKSRVLRSIMEKQGIAGPPDPVNPSFDLFDGLPDMGEISHNIMPHVLPWTTINIKLFGNVHLNWWIREPRLVITEPRMIWDLFIKKHQHFIKSNVLAILADDIFHKSTFHANGKDWSTQRKLVAPALYIGRVKAMLEDMVNSTGEVLQKWESLMEGNEKEREIDVQSEFMFLNVDIVAKSTFGITNCDSKRIVNLVAALLKLQEEQETWSWLPFARLVPLKVNIQRWRLRRELNQFVRKQVTERKKTESSDSRDLSLLGVMLEEMNDDVVVAECRTLYATGFGSLTPLLSFTMLMLATYPTWQEKAREEVDEVLSQGKMDAIALNKLKIVEMILRETMRLYPTMPLLARVCIKDTMLGDVFIPKGLGITVPVVALHHDQKLWGKDVHEFNPYRFESGTATAAKHPMAFMPFSFGVRTCVGRAFSEIQCKVVIASILQRFEIKPSPNYRHHPIIVGPLVPKYGMPVILKSRQNNLQMCKN